MSTSEVEALFSGALMIREDSIIQCWRIRRPKFGIRGVGIVAFAIESLEIGLDLYIKQAGVKEEPTQTAPCRINVEESDFFNHKINERNA